MKYLGSFKGKDMFGNGVTEEALRHYSVQEQRATSLRREKERQRLERDFQPPTFLQLLFKDI